MSNPQVGDLEDMVFLRPAITEHTDKATGEKVGVTWMPSEITANVRDAEHPEGVKRHLSMRNQVILGAEKVDALRFSEGRPCLACKSFDHVKGQAEIQRQNLGGTIAEIGLNLGYNPHAIKLEDWGLCDQGASNGAKAASPMGTCAHWQPRRRGWKHYMRGAGLAQTAGGLIDAARKTAEAVSSSVDAVVGFTVNDKRGAK